MSRLPGLVPIATLVALAAGCVPRPEAVPDLRRLLDTTAVVTAPAGPDRLYALPVDGPLENHIVLVETGAQAKALDLLRYEEAAWTPCVHAASVDFQGDGRPEIVIWKETGIQWHIDVNIVGLNGDRLTLLAAAGPGDGAPEVAREPATGRACVAVPDNVWSALGFRFGQRVRVFAWAGDSLSVIREYRRLPKAPWVEDAATAAFWDEHWALGDEEHRRCLLDHWRDVTGADVGSREEALRWWSGNRDRFRDGDFFVFPSP